MFVHVRDAHNNLVTQADGAVLGRMLPMQYHQSGDRIVDVRYLTLPEEAGPYSVQVGIYDADGRFAAFMDAGRAADDAAPVAVIALQKRRDSIVATLDKLGILG